MFKKTSFIAVFICSFIIGLTFFVANPISSQAGGVDYCGALENEECINYFECDYDKCDSLSRSGALCS